MFNPNQAFLLVQQFELGPKGFYTRSQRLKYRNKIFSICPKLLIKAELYGLVSAPRLKKDTMEANLQQHLGGQCPSFY
jgi:hypothetical protein